MRLMARFQNTVYAVTAGITVAVCFDKYLCLWFIKTTGVSTGILSFLAAQLIGNVRASVLEIALKLFVRK